MKSTLLDIKHDVFYLCDIFEKHNLLTKQFQSLNSNLILCKETISGVIRKIEIYVKNIRRPDFLQLQKPKKLLINGRERNK